MASSPSISSEKTRTIDPDKLNALLGQAVQDMGAAMQAPLIVIGDKLGLYRAMADGVPVTPGAAGQAYGHRRALCPRMAECQCRGTICGV